MARLKGFKHSDETKLKIGLANSGRKFSDEIKKKMSLACFGRKQSSETIAKRIAKTTGMKRTLEFRQKLSESRKREKCNFWQGGKTEINKIIRMSLAFRLWREAVFTRDNWTCVWCGKRGGELNPDHIKPFASYPKLRFEISNGRTLCRTCHMKTETWGKPRIKLPKGQMEQPAMPPAGSGAGQLGLQMMK